MILHGNQRGGGKDLALHLMKDENERVQVHELRGFVSEDLVGAFKESYAISKATRCKQHLFSLSINPPKDTDIDDETFIDAIDQTEQRLGLVGQPRAIVFHEKRGTDGELRRHAHAVWCRIDTESMKAVQLSHSKLKLRDVSRDLHIQHDLKMPCGLINSKDRDPRNFTLAEWQQCKRSKKDPRDVKDTFKDCWAISDSRASFAHSLEERGYILAKGRRGHVAVDYKGEAYAVSRYVGLKAKDVRAKLGEADGLPSFEEAHAKARKQVTDRLATLLDEQKRSAERVERKAEHGQTVEKQRSQTRLEALQRQQSDELKQAEEQQRRLRKGLMGFVDRLTGKRKKTLLQNEWEAQQTREKQQTAAEALQAQNRERLRRLEAERVKHIKLLRASTRELETDIRDYSRLPEPKKDLDKSAFKERARSKRKNRSHNRSREGPSLAR